MEHTQSYEPITREDWDEVTSRPFTDNQAVRSLNYLYSQFLHHVNETKTIMGYNAERLLSLIATAKITQSEGDPTTALHSLRGDIVTHAAMSGGHAGYTMRRLLNIELVQRAKPEDEEIIETAWGRDEYNDPRGGFPAEEY